MGFEYQKEPGKTYPKVTYTDEVIDYIYKTKTNLKIDVEKELDTLKSLKAELEKEYEEACLKRDSIADWDSDEAIDADDECNDLYSKIDVLDDWIYSLEELNEKL